MLDEIVASMAAELTRLDEAAPQWRSALLHKALYEIEPERRPAPNGLSRDYIDLARTLDSQGRAETAAERAERTSALLVISEGMIQSEVARAILHEHDLLRAYADSKTPGDGVDVRDV